MKIIKNEVLLDESFYQNKSFNRLREALKNIDNIEDNVAYNIVDSVIYIKNPNVLIDNGGLKKIYNTIIVNGSDQEIDFIIGEKDYGFDGYIETADFKPAKVTTNCTLKPNQAVIFEIDEPYKITSKLPSGIILAYVSKYNGIK